MKQKNRKRLRPVFCLFLCVLLLAGLVGCTDAVSTGIPDLSAEISVSEDAGSSGEESSESETVKEPEDESDGSAAEETSGAAETRPAESDKADPGDENKEPADEEDTEAEETAGAAVSAEPAWTFSLKDVPAYSGEPYVELNGNVPVFLPEDYTEESFEHYARLDRLGRCGTAFVNVCAEIMPTEPRGEIGDVRPSGWHTEKYPDRIEDIYLYNRCHLVAYQLSGENDNVRNLITGTRYMNVEGMLPFENRVYAYAQSTGNHVLYRAEPVFDGKDLVAKGVRLEAASVEDGGKGLAFHVFIYNVQPGVLIDYADGSSREDPDYEPLPAFQTSEQEEEDQVTERSGAQTEEETPAEVTYVGNANSKKFHLPGCGSVDDMAEHNKVYFYGSREEVIEKGYAPCKRCNP